MCCELSRLLITILLLSAPHLHAQSTWYVDQAGNGDFTSIQGAVGSPLVQDGDTIMVRPGAYIESVSLDKDLSVESTAGPLTTTIQPAAGNALATGFINYASFTGFTFSCLNTPDTGVTGYGTLELNNCIIRDAWGAPAVNHVGLLANSCTFENNSSHPLYATGEAVLTGCIFESNSEAIKASGGLPDELIFQSCSFFRNSFSYPDEAAIMVYAATFDDCYFEKNTRAIYVRPKGGIASPHAVITGSTFFDNNADSSSAAAIFVDAEYGSTEIYNSRFISNSGGSTVLAENGSFEISGCSFTNNQNTGASLSLHNSDTNYTISVQDQATSFL